MQPGDQTACLSCLFSPTLDEHWADILPDWENDIGKTIGELCSPESGDADAEERVFRRPKCESVKKTNFPLLIATKEKGSLEFLLIKNSFQIPILKDFMVVTTDADETHLSLVKQWYKAGFNVRKDEDEDDY